MLQVLKDGLRNAHAVDISVSFLRCSGLGLIRDDLREFVGRGGKARLLTSTYMCITQPEALHALLAISGIESRIHIGSRGLAKSNSPITGFHPKFYIFTSGEAECWVGSSNLTKGGLTDNVEANIRHSGPDAVDSMRQVFDLLWTRSDVVPVSHEIAQEYERYLRTVYKPPLPLNWTPPAPIPDPQQVRGAAQQTLKAIEVHQATEPNVTQVQISPNEAQTEALERLRDLRALGALQACVIAAPGVGKTFLAAFDVLQAGARNVLFLSHRKEHLTQAIRTFRHAFNDTKTYGRLFEGYSESAEEFLFATVQSAAGNQVVVNRRFDYVVVDEFHHAEAPSYKQLLATLDYKFLLGLTATPERQDGHDVLALCDFNVAYEIRLVEAISRGWLLPFHYFGISDDTVDYSIIPWRSGRFSTDSLEVALMLEERVNEIEKHALQLGFDGPRRATIGFCAGVRHAKFMADSFNLRGKVAVAVTGEDPVEYREAVYARLADVQDNLEWVFVADVLNEGVDIPCINSILFLRPTESATIFIQQLGRGLRLSPGCEVLTVLDFVGHHKSAWLTLSVLHDPDAGANAATIGDLDFTPPARCEVVLDSRTLEILKKIKGHTESKRDLCLAAYNLLREEEERPYPLHLWGRSDVPELSVFKSTFGPWINLRRAAGDAEQWEMALQTSDSAFRFLAAVENDWQAQRVYPYALLWALTVTPHLAPAQAYDGFFERFPIWKCEYKPLDNSKAWQSLQKNLGDLLLGEAINPAVLQGIPQDYLVQELEGRLRLRLARDYRIRHGGVLRSPADLVLHRQYSRPEIVNYFGQQYDPAKHNFGLINFGNALAIITKIDTSGAKQEYQYTNRFASETAFVWQSQNQQRQDNAAGRLIVDHKKDGRLIFLFVQSRSHEKAIYCGQLEMESVQDNAPMNVRFRLLQELQPSLFAELSVNLPTLEPVIDVVPASPANVDHEPDQEYTTLLPMYSLSAAAGCFGRGEIVEPMGWLDARRAGKIDKHMFVARAMGRSMEPLIHDNDLLVFRSNPTGSRQGKIVLVEYRGPADPDTGGSYTVKKYQSVKQANEGSEWMHTRITLHPLNPEYEPIEIHPEDAEDFRIVAEFVQVLPQP